MKIRKIVSVRLQVEALEDRLPPGSLSPSLFADLAPPPI